MADRDKLGRYIKGHKSGMTGKKHSRAWLKTIKKVLTGHKFWGGDKGWFKKGEHHSQPTEFKKGITPWNKNKKMSPKMCAKMKKYRTENPIRYWLGKKRESISGSKHPCWKGGVTPLNEKIRKSVAYITWRKKVYERDSYTCRVCDKKGGKLHAHHIYKFSIYPLLRFDTDNGVTMCKQCHKNLHSGLITIILEGVENEN